MSERAGVLVRQWRTLRRLSQLELAHRAGVSPRHLSCVETDRSAPGRDLLLRIGEVLDVPLRERNRWLLAAGFAPVFTRSDLGSAPMAAVHAAVETVLNGHEPFPALVVDRHWTIVAANRGVDLLTEGCAPDLVEPPANALRLSLHPRGLAPRIVNLSQWRAHLLSRLARQVHADPDPVLGELLAELTSYPAGTEARAGESPSAVPAEVPVVIPLRIETGAGVLDLVSTTTVFGVPQDVTVAELAIETFYPATPATTEAVRATMTRATTADVMGG